MEDSANAIRTRVADTYSRAIRSAETAASGCCGSIVGCCSPPGAVGAETENTTAVPSFGCGDPLLFANVRQGATVLDLGSGAGYDLIAAATRVGPTGHVIGVDMTDDMIEAARRNIAEAGFENVEIRKGFIENLPVESESVDWVISNCVINLSPEKDRVFAEIARVLRPGGHFSISDICASDLPEWLLADEAAYDGCIAGAVSETAYVHGLRRAGLTDLLIDSKIRYEIPELRDLAEEAGSRAANVTELDLEDVAGRVWSIRFTGRKPSR